MFNGELNPDTGKDARDNFSSNANPHNDAYEIEISDSVRPWTVEKDIQKGGLWLIIAPRG